MHDSWSFGDPAPKRPSLPSLKLGKPALLVGVAILVVLSVFALFKVVNGGAKAAGDQVRTELKQVDVAADTDAQSSAHNADVAAKVFFTENGGYVGLTPSGLSAIEPSLRYVDANQASADAKTVSVFGSTDGFGAAVMSASGTCYWIHDSAEGLLTYGSGSPCTGSAAMSASKPAW